MLPLQLEGRHLLTLHRIFLLSQDKDEIFLTFPRWGKAYGKDKEEGKGKSRGKGKGIAKTNTKGVDIGSFGDEDFLWMHEHGPFRLISVDDVEYVANFLHGYTLNASRVPD